MAFCPDCGYEYKTEVSQCPDCGTALVDSLPGEDAVDTATTWVKLPSLPGRLYAEMLKEVLDKEGIPSIIAGSGLAPTIVRGTEGDSVIVKVPEEYLEKCSEIQSDMFKDL